MPIKMPIKHSVKVLRLMEPLKEQLKILKSEHALSCENVYQNIHNVFDKILFKSKADLHIGLYELKKYCIYVLNELSVEDYKNCILSYQPSCATEKALEESSKNTSPNKGQPWVSQEIEKNIHLWAVEYYFKHLDFSSLFYLTKNGYKLTYVNADFHLKKLLANSQIGEEIATLIGESNDGKDFTLASKERKETIKIINVFKQVDWAKVSKVSYIALRTLNTLKSYVSIVGKENITFGERQALFYDSIGSCNKSMLNYFTQELGATIYPSSLEGKENTYLKKMLFKKEHLPYGVSYGIGTLMGRRNISSLMRKEDKTPENELWATFVKRSFDCYDKADSFLFLSLKEMAINGDASALYELNKKAFWMVVASLDLPQIKDCLKRHKQEGWKPSGAECAQIIKCFLPLGKEKIDLLLEAGLDFKHFLKSSYAQSLQSDTGFTKNKNIPAAVVREMRETLQDIKALLLFERLEDKLGDKKYDEVDLEYESRSLERRKKKI